MTELAIRSSQVSSNCRNASKHRRPLFSTRRRQKPMRRSPSFFGSSGVAADITTYRRGQAPRTESTVALQVERQALEESCDVPQSIAAPLQHVQLGVQPFDKAARVMVDDGVGNPIQPGIQQLQECIEASQAALFDPPPPEADAPQPLFLRGCTVDED